MTKILFVDDHLGLIDELALLLRRMKGTESLVLRFATNIEDAVEKLIAEQFNVVVADVMLPNHPGVPQHEEGIYLFAWLLGYFKKLPISLKKRERTDWLERKKCCPVFLSSRTADSVRVNYRQLAGKDADDIPIVERLRVSTYDQAKEILKIANREG